jgi:hypothetical protein
MKEEVYKILREFYSMLLRDYDGQPVEASVIDALNRLEKQHGDHPAISAHRNLNSRVCVAKAVLEKL